MSAILFPAPPPETVRDFGPIRLLPGRNGGRYPYCHSLVLRGAETWLIDPSSDKDALQGLARSRTVTAVFLSHFHEDHQKYRHFFPEARVFAPAAELQAFASLEGVFAFMGVDNPELRASLEKIFLDDFHFQPPAKLTPYHPGQRFHNGEIILEVVPAPGHTPGHSCFAFPNQDLIFLADVDLTPFGPWYGDAASDLRAWEETLARLHTVRARTCLTAHEQGIFTPEQARAGLAHFQKVIKERDVQILEALQTPRTLPRLVDLRLIYGKPREPLAIYNHMEAQMLSKHLERLQTSGRVSLTDRGYLANF
jgi:hydroxyacylglutathione hydrolase